MLKIDHLVKNYNTFSLDCSLEVLPGQITGLVGKNGAGKSTTFHAVLGLLRPDSGKITLLGKDSQEITAKDKQKLGVVLSDSGAVPVDFTACCKCIFLRTFRALRAVVYGSYDCDLICRRPYHVCGAVPHG